MRHIILFAVLLLAACGASDNGATATSVSVPVATSVPTETQVVSSPTPRPTVTVVQRATVPAAVTAVPLLDSITVMYIEQGWDSISPMLADPGLKEIGEASADKPFEQSIPFKVEGITLVASTQFSRDKLSNGGMMCVLYSRSDRTQWVIPVAVELERQEAPGTYRVFATAQDPHNVIARSAIPSGLRIVVFR